MDDLKASHVDDFEITKVAVHLQKIFGGLKVR